MPDLNHRITLARRPHGLVSDLDFVHDEVPRPELAEGEALMRTRYLSIDPTVRTWISEAKSYFPPVEIGEVVRCSGAGEVVATRTDAFEVGELVYSLPGWQEYAVIRDDPFVSRLPPGTDLVKTLGIFGGNGMAAYFGLLDVGEPREGETVLVSGAAGGTGSLVGQLARIKGCRAVGIAGSDEKCRWVTDELGFDACVNYRAEGFTAALREATPDRVDIYFDNVGGWILDEALHRLNMHGRVVLCGAISVYNEEAKPAGPSNYLDLITNRARMEGFNAFDYWDRFPEVVLELAGYVEDGRLRYREHVVEGLDRAPEALNMLFTGENVGKLVVALVD